jgi:hypothetical protein
LGCLDLESFRKGFHGVHGRRVLLTLNHADVVAIKRCPVSELLLCEPTFLAQSLEISSQDPPERHELQRSPSPSKPPPSILGFRALLTARMVVASETPTVAWHITVDAGADVYIACLKAPDAHAAETIVRLPRRTVDDAVLAASGITLEVTPDGSVAAYAESGVRTLVRAPLSALIAEAVSPHALSAEEEPAVLGRLEAELVRALELVRQARR